MQPYLVYGFGIRAKNLPESVKEKLIETTESYAWFFEDAAGSTSDDGGVYYVIKSSPWTRTDESKTDLGWADDLKSILKFKEEHADQVEQAVEALGLQAYSRHVEFICSVTEI